MLTFVDGLLKHMELLMQVSVDHAGLSSIVIITLQLQTSSTVPYRKEQKELFLP